VPIGRIDRHAEGPQRCRRVDPRSACCSPQRRRGAHADGNQIKALMITAPEQLRDQLRELSLSTLIHTCA